MRKLIKLNGGKLRLPQQRQNYVNLTNYLPDQDEEALLQLGLNCHYADKPKPHQKRLEIEVLLDSLLSLEKEKKVELSDSIRPLLLAEALTTRHPEHNQTLMTRTSFSRQEDKTSRGHYHPTCRQDSCPGPHKHRRVS